METRTRFQKIVLLALAVMTVLFGVLMAFSTTRKGIVLEDTLLRVQKRQSTADTTVYSGKLSGEPVTVSVRENGIHHTLTYTVADRIQDEYEIVYPTGTLSSAEETMEKREIPGIQIAKNGRLYFQGGYETFAGDVRMWYDRTGHLYDVYDITWDSGGTVSCAPEELQCDQLADFAIDPVPVARGDWRIYGLLLLVSCAIAVDVAAPTFWFDLNHSCNVRNPEPSDFYIAMQRISWVIYPILLCIGYLVALYHIP